jgi:hypothetical protein
MSAISKNQVSLAGEFAVLSQLALRGFDANMTLGNTKGVDILVSQFCQHENRKEQSLRGRVSIPYLLTICLIKRTGGKYGYLAKFGRPSARGTDGLKFFRRPPGPH